MYFPDGGRVRPLRHLYAYATAVNVLKRLNRSSPCIRLTGHILVPAGEYDGLIRAASAAMHVVTAHYHLLLRQLIAVA